MKNSPVCSHPCVLGVFVSYAQNTGGRQGAAKVSGAGSLPASVPSDTTLSGVHVVLKDVMGEMKETGAEPSNEAAIQATTRVAVSPNYDLRFVSFGVCIIYRVVDQGAGWSDTISSAAQVLS